MDKQTFSDFINNINDKIFKAVFKNKPSAVEYLQVFASSIADNIDLENLSLADTNFLGDELDEYFSDVVFETTLKNPDVKNKIRVVLLFEHKKGIGSYFDLFLQLLSYIVMIWKDDRKARRSPTIVIPFVINQSKRHIKEKTLHDSLRGVPNELLKFVPQLQYHILNVQPLDDQPIDEKILQLSTNNILRSLFLSYIAVEQNNKLDNILIEIFKFYKESPHLKDYFQQIFVFLTSEGYFSDEEIKELLANYLTKNEQKDMLTTAQRWKQEGLSEGQLRKARLVTLRGIFKEHTPSVLTDLTGLNLSDVLTLMHSFEVVKNAWLQKKSDILAIASLSQLSENEVRFILGCLNEKI